MLQLNRIILCRWIQNVFPTDFRSNTQNFTTQRWIIWTWWRSTTYGRYGCKILIIIMFCCCCSLLCFGMAGMAGMDEEIWLFVDGILFHLQNPDKPGQFSYCQYPFILSIVAKRHILTKVSSLLNLTISPCHHIILLTFFIIIIQSYHQTCQHAFHYKPQCLQICPHLKTNDNKCLHE